MIDIRDHGAMPAGSGNNVAANTAAVQAAVTESLATREGREVYIPDQTAFDPSGIDWGASRQLSVAVSGSIYPSTVWTVGSFKALRGVGGMGGSQFQIGRPAYIYRPAGLANTDPTVRVAGHSNKLLQDVAIFGGTGVALHLDDAPNTILERVSASTNDNAPSSIGLKVSDSYWVWTRDCVFSSGRGGLASIYITNDTAGGDAAGNIVFDGLRMMHAPIVLDYGAGSPTGGIGLIRIADATMEIPERSFLKVLEGTPVRSVELTNCIMADATWHGPSGVVGFIENLGTIKALTVNVSDELFNSPTFIAGRMPEQVRYTAPAVPIRWSDRSHHPSRGMIIVDGEVEAADALRGIADPIQSRPFPSLAIPYDPLAWSRPDAGLAMTAGQLDPRGLHAAGEAEWPAEKSGYGRLQFWAGTRTWEDGEWLIAGVWLRNALADLNIETPVKADVLFCETPHSSGWRLNETHNFVQASSEILRQPAAGWTPFVRAIRLTKSSPEVAASAYLNFGLRLQPGTRFRVWQPFLLRPGTGWTAREVMRVAKTLTRLPGDVAPGHVGTDADVTFKTGRGPSRPDAAVVGDGAQWFDTALGRPIWSRGGAWVTACGAIAP